MTPTLDPRKIILYRTESTNDRIVEVAAVKVSPEFVYLLTPGYKSTVFLYRVRRSSLVTQFHESFVRAKYYLHRKLELDLKRAERRVVAIKDAMLRIDRKTKPDAVYKYETKKPDPGPIRLGE